MSTELRESLKPTGNTLLTVSLVVAALYFGREVFVPLALATLLSFLLVPVSSRLERLGLPRAPSALLVVFVSLAAIAALGWVMLGQVYSLAVELPQYEQNITQKIDSLHLHSAGRLSNTLAMLSNEMRQLRGGTPASSPPAPLIPEPPRRRTKTKSQATPDLAMEGKDQVSSKSEQPVTVRLEEPEESVLTLANRTLTPLIHPVTTIFVLVIFLSFMLVSREDLRDRCIRLAGRGRMQVTTSAIEDAGQRVGRYLRMQLIVNFSFGAAAGLCLWAVGVPNPVLWALLIALLRFVPYIGILMASAGPLLLSVAVSPHWGTFLWTALVLFLLELIVGNIAEPLLYSSSTGLSPIAVLIAAIFWTLLWGLPGLLLSTPLTVCLVVIGRQVPHLEFLEVLLGDESALPPAERLYQRLLASNTHEARSLLRSLFTTQSREAVFDAVVIPVLTLVEESRRAEELTLSRSEEMLQSMEELVEDVLIQQQQPQPLPDKSRTFIACIPARDFADEIASELASHVLTSSSIVRVFAAETSTNDIFETLDTIRADFICIVGVPPGALRHVRLRCHQVRKRYPEAVVFACILSEQCDLPNIRARIPIEDAQHVVCSLQQMSEYVSSLLDTGKAPSPSSRAEKGAEEAKDELSSALLEVKHADVDDDEAKGDAFEHLASNLAHAFDAPISLITVADGERHFWEAHCGLPEEALFPSANTRAACSCASLVSSSEEVLVIPDTAEDPRTADDPFFKQREIRFYAGTPLRKPDGDIIGALCVLDTRPREINDKHKELLLWIAEVVTTAIELRNNAQSDPATREPAAQLEPEASYHSST